MGISPKELAFNTIGYAASKSGLITEISDQTPIVFMYHSIGVEGGFDNISIQEFRRHLEWLDHNYNVVELQEALERPTGEKQVAITFDDGLTSFYENAKPILEEYSMPATQFVLTAAVREHPHIEVEEILQKRLNTPETLMSPDQLDELAADPLVTIGSHTWSHVKLPEIDDPDKLKREIVKSKAVLESELGISVNQFAYPYSLWDETSHEIVANTFDYAVRNAGVTDTITKDTNPYLIPRVNGGTNLTQFKFRISDFGKRVARFGSSILS